VSEPEAVRVHRQPWLHELSICVNGNATALSSPSGDIEQHTVQGLYVDDRRVISGLSVLVGGEKPEPVAGRATGGRAEYLAAARGLGNPGADPTVEVRRTRILDSGMSECVEVTSRAATSVVTTVRFAVASDGLDLGSAKSGRVSAPATPAVLADGLVTFSDEWHTTTVEFTPPPTRLASSDGMAEAEYDIVVGTGESTSITVHVASARSRSSQLDADPGSDAITWSDVRVSARDPRLTKAFERSIDDVRHLLLRDPDDPRDVFVAAGTPWFLTLFGRDSIWVARMLLPFGTELADGTLRTLARRQGTVTDLRSGEAPGKIAHEIRREAYVDPDSGMELSPVYYGTVDATALWVILLAEAWRWGLARDRVEELVPALRRAVGWLCTDARPDPDGFLKYLDHTGTGLANQGWKDSGDSVRWRDGRIAEAPIALVEAQAYAVEALSCAAVIYRAFDVAGADEVEASAALLRDRTRDAFWVDTDAGRHLAIALDAQGRPVDGLASNMGHVLGTGVLTQDEAKSVAATLTSAEMLDDFGIRTLGSGNGGFNPIGYHTGSIWTHDTAITAWGLAREGLVVEAAIVARTLLASAEAFDYRWPELYSGLPLMGRPTPYPASCRPQAWSAASAAVLVSVALGLSVNVASGRLEIRPAGDPAFGAMKVEGLRWAGQPFSVNVDASGRATTEGLAPSVDQRALPRTGDAR